MSDSLLTTLTSTGWTNRQLAARNTGMPAALKCLRETSADMILASGPDGTMSLTAKDRNIRDAKTECAFRCTLGGERGPYAPSPL